MVEPTGVARRPRTVAGVALALALGLGLGGCGGDGSAGPTTTGATETTTTTTEATSTTEAATTTTDAAPQDETAAVLAAYEAAWAVFPSVLNGEATEPLDAHYTGERLANIPGFIAQYAERGIRLVGGPVIRPGPVTIDGTTATFVDCLLDQSSDVVAATGEVIDGPDELPQTVDVRMEKEGDVWKLASAVFGENGSCTQ